MAELANNVELILKSVPGFTIDSQLAKVLGRTLGLAREKHVRSALKLLKDRDVIVSAPVGKLQKAYITRK